MLPIVALMVQVAVPTRIDTAAMLRCDDRATGGEVIVCGRREDRHRLPLPVERDPAPGHVRGEARTGLDAITPPGRCGIFAGERACSKREAAAYGYGEGRDPVTVLSKLAGAVLDPDR